MCSIKVIIPSGNKETVIRQKKDILASLKEVPSKPKPPSTEFFYDTKCK